MKHLLFASAYSILFASLNFYVRSIVTGNAHLPGVRGQHPRLRGDLHGAEPPTNRKSIFSLISHRGSVCVAARDDVRQC